MLSRSDSQRPQDSNKDRKAPRCAKLRQVLQLCGQRGLRCLCFLEPGFNSRLRFLATASTRPHYQQSHAKPCKAMQSLQGPCTPCIRFPSKDFEDMHGIFNTSHSHESMSMQTPPHCAHAAHAACQAPSGPLLLSWMFGMSSMLPPKC